MPSRAAKTNSNEKQSTTQTKQQNRQPLKSQGKNEQPKQHSGFPYQKLFISIAVVVVVLAAVGILLASPGLGTSPADETNNPSDNLVAPNFSLKDINGTQVSLNQYSGKPILVHFMALSGCTGEVSQIDLRRFEQLRSVYSQYSDQIGMVTVSVATCAGCDTILAQMRKDNGISWCLGNDYDDQKLEIVEAYSRYQIYDGTMLLIDKSFNVVKVYNDDTTVYRLTADISQLQ